MTERRSNRARSNINYSKYEGDDDDDFADPTPPMRKLKKDKENCNKSAQEKEKIVTTDKKSKRKPPPEDRLLDLHLKKALAASLKECGNLQTESDNRQTVVTDDLDRCCLVDDNLTSTQKDTGKDSKVKNGDEIEVISTITISDSPPRKRQKTTSRYSCLDSESDNDQDRTYAAESDASDVDEFEPDNDVDDFNSNKKSKNKKKRKVQTVTKVSKTPVLKSTVKTPTLSKSISKLEPRLFSTPTVTVNTPGVSSSARTVTPKSTSFPKTPVSLPQKIPSWTPPGPAGRHGGGSLNIKSPGGIRIGLSRQQRVKALHPSLTVQP